MRLLLDTHIAMWAVSESDRLSDDTLEMITSPNNDVIVSVVSIWEIAIKHAQGKASAPRFSGARATRMFEAAGYEILPVLAPHAAATEALPPIHRDPFDRLLVAQSRVAPMRFVTHDAVLRAYGSDIILV